MVYWLFLLFFAAKHQLSLPTSFGRRAAFGVPRST